MRSLQSSSTVKDLAGKRDDCNHFGVTVAMPSVNNGSLVAYFVAWVELERF